MRWRVITDALHRGVTSPKLLAALSRLAAEIPGARVVPNLQDDLGRPVTEIQYVTRLDRAGVPQTEQLILDTKSLRYLGSRTVVGEPRSGLARGTVLTSTMLVEAQRHRQVAPAGAWDAARALLMGAPHPAPAG